jgi:hypothetical protein
MLLHLLTSAIGTQRRVVGLSFMAGIEGAADLLWIEIQST